MTADDGVVLRARGVSRDFRTGSGLSSGRSTVRAVDQVDLELHEGEIFGLVGESGCGKSTLGKMLARLLEPTSGTIELAHRDITRATRRQLRTIHHHLRMVFQDPYSSLDPRKKIGQIVAEPLRLHRIARGDALRQRVETLFDRCGLDPTWHDRYPHELSGGQRQRVGIARALSLEPQVLIADEPVSALDVSVQASILNLLLDLQDEMGFTCLFISHDLSVVEYVSDRIAVMYLGRIVEVAAADELFAHPKHPYTQALLSAELPIQVDPTADKRITLSGDVPSPLHPPSGCHFHTRCPVAVARCEREEPPLSPRQGDDHPVACHLVGADGSAPVIPSRR